MSATVQYSTTSTVAAVRYSTVQYSTKVLVVQYSTVLYVLYSKYCTVPHSLLKVEELITLVYCTVSKVK